MPVLKEYEAAVGYADRGWTVLPMRLAEKKPQVKWKRYQYVAPSGSTLYRWFRNTDSGVGVLYGKASGGLASRDFDDHKSYNRWAEQHPALAHELPTVETRRGFHVYCNLWPESVTEARRRLGKPVNRHGCVHLGDGELRAGAGCYSILPPSTHPSGHVYQWKVLLPAGEMPTHDACEVGFCDFPAGEPAFHNCHTVNTSNKKERDGREKTTQTTSGTTGKTPPGVPLTAENAIEDSLPSHPGQRHQQVFELARRLKAVPELAEQKAASLRLYVMEWHRRSQPTISTKHFEETWIDFLKAWDNVQHPWEDDFVKAAFDRACAAGLPDLPEDYEQSEIWLLASLCRELQRSVGDQPFFLSCRDAGRLLEAPHKQANRWLFLLVVDGVLELVETGTMKARKASQYRYLGEL